MCAVNDKLREITRLELTFYEGNLTMQQLRQLLAIREQINGEESSSETPDVKWEILTEAK
jgi:hypothetical protein